MSGLPSIQRVREWAAGHRTGDAASAEAADFILSVLDGEVPPDRLAAIQRSFQPIDDDGTLRMEVRRQDVDELLAEVLFLRSERLSMPEEAEPPATVAENVRYLDADGVWQQVGVAASGSVRF